MAPEADPAVARQHDDLELAGEVTLDTDHGPVTVRAHSWADGMRLTRHWHPIVSDLFADVPDPDPDDDAPPAYDPFAFMQSIARHFDHYMALLELATGRNAEWLDSLSDSDGLRVMEAYWALNRGFFTRRVASVAISRALRSPTSTANSSPPATPSPTSAATPQGNSGSTTAPP